MIRAYCDSSTGVGGGQVAVAVSLILDDTQFYGMDVQTYQDIKTPTEAELVSVIQAVSYVKNNFPDIKDLLVLCDCATVVKQMSGVLKNGIPKNIKYPDKWKKLTKVCDGLSITVKHTKGHLQGYNANNICDSIARSVYERVR